MTMVRGQWSQLMAPGLHKLFVHWTDLKQRDLEYPRIFHEETSDKAYEDEVEFSGFGDMPQKPEGESVTYTDAVQGGTKRYVHSTYALGVRTSWELYEDDQYKLIQQVPKGLARSSVFRKEVDAWSVFNLGFTTVTTTDGVSLFHNQHPLLGGTAATALGPGVSSVISAAGTFPNRPAVDVDFSFTAVQNMIDQFERMIDSQGIPIVLRPKYLIIPPELKWLVRETLASPYKPTDANNAINALLGEDLESVICHYLTSRTAWFAVCEKDAHQLKFITRKSLDEDYADDFDTRSIKQIAFMRHSAGATSWIGTWGSNGP